MSAATWSRRFAAANDSGARPSMVPTRARAASTRPSAVGPARRPCRATTFTWAAPGPGPRTCAASRIGPGSGTRTPPAIRPSGSSPSCTGRRSWRVDAVHFGRRPPCPSIPARDYGEERTIPHRIEPRGGKPCFGRNRDDSPPPNVFQDASADGVDRRRLLDRERRRPTRVQGRWQGLPGAQDAGHRGRRRPGGRHTQGEAG